MRSIEFYIDINSWEQGETAEYKRLDTFGFENIEITSKVQDVRDIAKVFTDFSSTFRVPASKENNKTFSRWFDNGFNKFDGRVKKRGIIKMDGFDFRKGYWKLGRVTHKNNNPSYYELVFFGEGVSLKDILKDDLLQNLDSLSSLNHEYSLSNVKAGLTSSLNIGSKTVKYPLMSHTNALIYDSSAYGNNGDDINLYSYGSGSDADYGIPYTLLKPAIKVIDIIEAIEAKYGEYGVNFSRDFFATPAFENLWFYLHKEKGGMLNGANANVAVLIGDDFSPDGHSTPLFPAYSSYQSQDNRDYETIRYNITVSNTSVPYRFYAVDTISGKVMVDYNGLLGNKTIGVICSTLTTGITQSYNIKAYIETEGDLGVVTPVVSKISAIIDDGVPTSTTFDYIYDDTTITIVSTVDVASQMPKMKVIDFLTGLFKTFNLTSEIIDGHIQVKDLNSYYSDGGSVDISNYIDRGLKGTYPANLYSNIEFSFNKSKTIIAVERNEKTGTEFGSLNTEDEYIVFDGGEYKVTLPFEKIMYTRLNDENGSALTDLQYGWLVDKDENPTITTPILMYIQPTISTDSFTLLSDTSEITTYNRPSNAYFTGATFDTAVQSINFNAELDEYFAADGYGAIEESLYWTYYVQYISNLYSENTRLYEYTTYLPSNVLNKIKMNSEVIVDGAKHTINSLKTSLLDRKVDFTLLFKSEEYIDLDVPENDFTPPDFGASVVTIDQVQDNSFRVSWGEATDDDANMKYSLEYKLSTDSDYISHSTGLTTNDPITIGGLLPNKTYDVKVTAYDTSGNSASRSNSQLTDDTQDPVLGGSITFSSITETTMNLSWNTATDNDAVSHYVLERGTDGTNYSQIGGNLNATSYSDSGLTLWTTYYYRVKAVDLVGNSSSYVSASQRTDDDTIPVISGNISTSSIGETTIGLSWTAGTDSGSGVASYRIGYKLSTASEYLYTTSTTNSKSISGLLSYREYDFIVYVLDNAGNESTTNLTNSFTTIDTTAPTMSGSISFSNIEETTFTLSWSSAQDSGSGVAGYKIYRGGSEIADQTGTTYNETGRITNTTYNYEVKAYDVAGNLMLSGITGSVLTADNTPPVAGSVIQQQYTANLSTNKASRFMRWNPATDNDGVKEYVVMYRLSTSNTWIEYETITHDGSADYSSTIPNLSQLTDYDFSVTVFDFRENSSKVLEVFDLTSPDCQRPVMPIVESYQLDQDTIRFTWGAASDNVGISYYLVNGVSNGLTRTYDVDGLSVGDEPTISVVAVDTSGNQSFVASVNTTEVLDITPPVIASISTTNITGSSIDVVYGTATDNVAVTTYRLHYKKSTEGSYSSFFNISTSGGTQNVSGLAEYTAYDFRLTAQDAAGHTTYLYSLGVTTADVTPPTIDLYTATSLEADENRVAYRFDWSAQDTPVSGGGRVGLAPSDTYRFRVYRDGDLQVTSWYDAPQSSTTFPSVGDLGSELYYGFELTVYDAQGNYTSQSIGIQTIDNQPPTFDPSDEVIIDFNGKSGSQSWVRVTWDAASDDHTPTNDIIYNVYYKKSSSSSWLFKAPTTGVQTISFFGLDWVTEYDFLVRAEDERGNETTIPNSIQTSVTTIAEYTTYSVTMGNNGGFLSDIGCDETPSVTRYSNTVNIQSGSIIFTDSNALNRFNGGNKWYSWNPTGSSALINSSGVVLQIESCDSGLPL